MARQGKPSVFDAKISQVLYQSGIGAEKRSKVISEKEKKITAYHEAGHAILFHVLPDMDPVYTISVIPTGRAQQDIPCLFRKMMRCSIPKARCYRILRRCSGGRVAEESDLWRYHDRCIQ